MRSIVGLCLVLFCSVSFARGGGSFGGSRSSSFSSSRSYSAPSRSYSAPAPSRSSGSFGGSQSTFRAPIVRPQANGAKVSGQNQAPTQAGQVTHNYYGGGGGYSGGGFWNGMLLGSLMNHGTTVVAPQGGVAYDNGYVGGNGGFGFGGFLFTIIILGGLALLVWAVLK